MYEVWDSHIWFKSLRIMRLTLGLLFILVANGWATNAYSQRAVLNLHMQNAKLIDVLNEIEEQTDYYFLFNYEQIDSKSRTSINLENATIEKALDSILEGTSLKYAIRDRQIILSKNEAGLPNGVTGFAAQKQKQVKGKVTSTTGEPIPGVSIIEKGTISGTITDQEGSYTIQASSVNGILVFSFVGMQKKEVPIAGQTTINVVLEEETIGLEEVVAVGYGVQKKSDLTGSITSVTTEKLNLTPSTSFAEMLRGKAAGVQVNLSSAAPGGSSSILIRGRRSLSGENAPLFIVDGVPMSSIDDVNSNDIASVEVLKDASSQSIYGARAANGVILVTTKRGMSGKPKVSYSTYFANQNIHRNFDFYNGEEWAAYRKEAYQNAYGTFDETDCFKGLMLDVLQSGEFVDWEDVMISSAWQQKHDLLVQAGGEKTKYAVGLGYFDQGGIVPQSDFTRFSGRMNLDYQLLDNLTLGTNISLVKSQQHVADGTFNSFITVPPLSKIYYDDGSLREDVTEAGESHYNPLWNINNSKRKNQTDRLLINVFADWKLTRNMTYRANGSYSDRTVHSNSYLGTKHTTGKNTGGKASVNTNFSKDYLFENILNFNDDINKDHHIDATLMQSINVIEWKSIGLNGTGFPNDDLGYNAIGSANEYGSPDWELSERKLVSFLGRVRYNYLGRYLFTAAMRVDGSSVFGENNKFGYFPSGAFAWRISDEPFMDHANWLYNLKLRVSYGQVGNQGVDPYTTLGLTNRYYTEFGSELKIGYLPSGELPNPDLKWETSSSWNLGLDYGLFEGRIEGSVELYDTQTTDLLVRRSLSETLGYSSQLVNLGHVQNRGIEATLSVMPVRTKDLNWSVNFTFYKNENKIKKIDGTLDENGKPKDDVNNKWFIGKPMNVYYDYLFDGIWQTGDDIANSHMPNAKPGYIKLKDVLEDEQITIDDRVVMERDPKWIGTVSTALTYKGFDLSAELYYSRGGVKYNPYLATFDTGGDLTGKRNGIRRNYWTSTNPSNEAPAPNMVQAPAYITSLAYQDATYLRLRNVTLGYKIPQTLCKKLHLETIRLYSTLTNYWTKTDVQAYGPEQDPGDYPEPRTALFGLNVTF